MAHSIPLFWYFRLLFCEHVQSMTGFELETSGVGSNCPAILNKILTKVNRPGSN